MTDAAAIERERAELEQRYGPWTAHNVRLTDDVYTISSAPSGDEVKLRRITQIVADLFDGAFEGLRVLDLACLEGMYALEFASRGADVVAIEGREANLAKARYAARTIGLEGIDWQLGDVRNLSRERHGEFDVVLCLGILYHLDADDLLRFVKQMADVCKRVLLVDTSIALTGPEERTHDGHVYRGTTLFEHDPASSPEERLKAVWSSLDNTSAWAPTRASLLSLLARSGFTSVYECWVPAEPAKTPARITLVALKGHPERELLSPAPTEDPARVPERPPLGARLPATRLWRLGRLVLPPPLRARIRALLGADTRRP